MDSTALYCYVIVPSMENTALCCYVSVRYGQHRCALFLIMLSTYVTQSALLYESAEMEQNRFVLLFLHIDCEKTDCGYWTMPTVQQSMFKI